MKMEQTECSETSAYKIQTPGNYPEESKQQSRNCSTLCFRNFPEFLRKLWARKDIYPKMA